MLTRLLRQWAHLGRTLARVLRRRLAAATKPAGPAVGAGALADGVAPMGSPALSILS